MQGVERYKVKLLPHDPMWETEFLKVKVKIQEILKDNVIDTEHIGSTSIREIMAKPILDIAVVVKSFSKMNIKAMTHAGYDNCGLQKLDNDPYLFVLRRGNEISLHHIHCYEPGNIDFKRCIGFRDYLNAHPEEVKQYSELKIKLANQNPDNRSSYTQGKTEFIQSVYQKLGLL